MTQKLRLVSLFILCFILQIGITQSVGINTTGATPDASSMLDVSASDKGILIPRMTTAERGAIINPAVGLLVYDTDTHSFWYRSNNKWENIDFDASELKDADDDTKVQVEQLPDEDMIRFSVAGEEIMKLSKNGNNYARMDLGNSSSVMIGNEAGLNNQGLHNTFIGKTAGKQNTTGSGNVFVGKESGELNTTGQRNTYIGVGAGFQNALSTDNTAVGHEAGHNSTGGSNIFMGPFSAWYNTTGSMNVGIGFRSLYANTTGSGNVGIGHDVLVNLANINQGLTQTENTYLGHQAGNQDLGSYNTVIGAIASAGSGTHNSVLGYNADIYGEGDNNIAIGRDASGNGNSNIYLGHDTGTTFGATPNYSTAIGYQATVKEDNTVIIGNQQNITEVGIGTLSPAAKLHVNKREEAGEIFRASNFSQPALVAHHNKGVSIGSDNFPDDFGLWVEGLARFKNDMIITGEVIASGNVNIGGGTNIQNYPLSVNGEIACEEIRVQASNFWPDYVFDEKYPLLNLSDLEKYIEKHNHLPGLPAANEIEGQSVGVGEMQEILLEKIEELFLYVIELKQENDSLRNLITQQK